MSFKIRRILLTDVKNEYIKTINSINTKKFIKFAKDGKFKKNKSDLIGYIKKIPKNEFLYGVFKNKTHVANFKFIVSKKRIYIGFLVFLKYQGKGIFKKIFYTIIKLVQSEYSGFRKLHLGVDPKNSIAISLYKKLGFKYEKESKRIMSFIINKDI